MRKLIIVCLLLGAGALLTLLPQLNYSVFSAINSAYPSPILWMTITNCGSVLFTGCLLFSALRSHPQLLSNALLCAIAIHYSVKFTKYWVAELRPEHTTDLLGLITLGPPLDSTNYSMPSGHTATAFMAAMFIARAHSLSRWKLGLVFFFAALIGISRIAVGAHWPGDVFAGAGLGILIGGFFAQLQLRWQHNIITWLSYALYLPFIVLAIMHISAINSSATAVSEGIIVAAGIAAAVLWAETLKI